MIKTVHFYLLLWCSLLFAPQPVGSNSESLGHLSSWTDVSYVLRGEMHVKGWRQNKNTVRSFVVTQENLSLAKVMFQDTSASGVIAIAFFAQKEQDQQVSKAVPKGLGTGWGAKKQSRVKKVKFNAEPTAQVVVLIKLVTEPQLRKMGLWQEENRNRLWSKNDQYIKFPDEN